MHKLLCLLLFIVDISLFPIVIVIYIIQAIDLLYISIKTKGNIREEFEDFNKAFATNIKNGVNTHIERIFGA